MKADLPIRDAASIILFRNDPEPTVLMGRRPKKAAFMPDLYVFPGGAVDSGDSMISLVQPLRPPIRRRLADRSAVPPEAIVVAAIRELWEETGLVLGAQARWTDIPEGWSTYAETGNRPSGAGLEFAFRAITPPGRSRRFDARFLIANAKLLASDADDFSKAGDELTDLAWVPLSDAKHLPVPFITQIVLAQIAPLVVSGEPPAQVPFFAHRQEDRFVDYID
ncbi:NUDIX hydrolase [Qingshengfaniella alkalisoli]|uniref:NUDIX hydrolase n=1 Tax=Qingshengfaniella alkalisoli TaxID=2599296 RepID=UPI001F0E2799|nr:NUDIX hydrolase [Qingshengfaniella alkalisoli]